MADEKQQDQRPLGAEAAKRHEWRGDGTVLQQEEVSGHTPPASESDPAAEDEGRSASAAPTTIPPPD